MEEERLVMVIILKDLVISGDDENKKRSWLKMYESDCHSTCNEELICPNIL